MHLIWNGENDNKISFLKTYYVVISYDVIRFLLANVSEWHSVVMAYLHTNQQCQLALHSNKLQSYVTGDLSVTFRVHINSCLALSAGHCSVIYVGVNRQPGSGDIPDHGMAKAAVSHK